MIRAIILGLDGVPYNLIKGFMQKGIMPNMKALIENGHFRKMNSSIPEISSVAWSSAITGKNPAEHGIFGFIDLLPSSYGVRYPNYANLKEKAFWDKIDGKSVIINVPSTYPVRKMKGVHISGFVSIDINKSVYPADLITVINEKNYKLDVNTEYGHKSYDLFLNDLDKTLDARMEVARFLWDYVDWQIYMLVFTGTDRLMHFLWNAYEDENNRYHEDFIRHFEKVDKAIGEIIERMEEEDYLVMLSDHGFERLDRDLNVNQVLKKEGLLVFDKEDAIYLRDISQKSKAFALDPGRIYLNMKGKFPRGSVDEMEREKLIEEIYGIFNELEYEGRKAIKAIFRKEEIYSGPYFNNAPDLVLIGNEGVNLKGNLKAKNTFEKSFFTGKHTYDSAFFYSGKPLKVLENKEDINVSILNDAVMEIVKKHNSL